MCVIVDSDTNESDGWVEEDSFILSIKNIKFRSWGKTYFLRTERKSELQKYTYRFLISRDG